jgi:hypothetical protein
MKKIIITWRRHRQAPGHRDGLAEKDRTGGVEGSGRSEGYCGVKGLVRRC